MKKIISLFTILLILLLTFSACSDSSADGASTPDPAPAVTAPPEPSPIPESSPEPTSEPEPAPPDSAHHSIVGWWSYAHGTRSTELHGTEEPSDFAYLDWLHPWAEILDDGTASFGFYGAFTGNLSPTGQHTFLLKNVVLNSEGMTDHLDDQWVSYDPSTGLLRHTFFQPYAEEYIHSYFERADGPPF